MWGLLLLFFMLVYFAAIIFLLIKVKPIWAKGLILIAAILIPNVDDWYYRHKLGQYCKTEAGIKVYQQVSRKEGLLVEFEHEDQFYAKIYPVSFIESPKKVGNRVVGYWRTDKLLNNVSESYKTSYSTARYEVKRIELDTGVFVEVTEQIVDRKNGAVAGEFKGLFYYGSWYPRALVGRGGLVAGCGVGGRVVTRKEWQSQDLSHYSINEVVNKLFSKE